MRRENLKSLIIISIIVMFSLSTTYAYLSLSASSSTEAGDGGCFEVAYEKGQDITGETLKSTTNYLNGGHTQMTFSKTADCDVYTEATIYLQKDEEVSDEEFLNFLGPAFKYKILSGGTEIESGAITSSLETSNGIALATVPLTTTETTYDIYIWIDSTISNGSYNGKIFSGYLYASAVQTSTINGES